MQQDDDDLTEVLWVEDLALHKRAFICSYLRRKGVGQRQADERGPGLRVCQGGGWPKQHKEMH